jgi:hypothetical protein
MVDRSFFSMIRRVLAVGVLSLAPACLLLADFSYEQTSTMTGGAMMAMMRFAGTFSKQAREPVKSTIMVKGDKMVHLNANRASIIDLAVETITEVDLQKKTYSVMTFAEMKQMLEQMAQKMKSGQGEANFKVTADATGNTRKINGLDAKEMIIKMEMAGTDAKSGQTGGMTIVTDSWLAAGVPGYGEGRDFHKRMAEKLNWTPGGGMAMSRPDVAKGMAEVAKEMAKLDGAPVLQVVKMGGPGQAGAGNPQLTPEQQAQAAQAQQQQAPQQQAQQQQQQQQPTTGSVLGSALGGKLGHFGGLGRKKQPQQQDQEQTPPPQQASAPPPPAAGAPSGDASGSLMEMTTEMTSFSSGPVDTSKFEVPAGFKKVESDMRRMR